MTEPEEKLSKFHEKLYGLFEKYKNEEVDVDKIVNENFKRGPEQRAAPGAPKKHVIDAKGHEPFSHWNPETESQYLKLATKGVIELFNMINNHRKRKARTKEGQPEEKKSKKVANPSYDSKTGNKERGFPKSNLKSRISTARHMSGPNENGKTKRRLNDKIKQSFRI
ncbi:hypothetical protein RF11_10264 [Thelohanellus kitauei]|uniref:Uncharacterized protein n=1 Tax=Thelohanellus kitauei TaxID=669202 RepID=A0A0C2N786_THEKT|nr:hypothetical protein RF11_10264 [Thelohanellus kitauei]